MNFLKDEAGQGAAEYILLFGGVIVIAIAALIVYRGYFNGTPKLTTQDDLNLVRSSVVANGSA